VITASVGITIAPPSNLLVAVAVRRWNLLWSPRTSTEEPHITAHMRAC